MSFTRNNKNRDQFNKQFNDIMIYVEDKGKEGIYLVIFRKLLKDLKLQVDNIFTCGGKEKVIEKYYEEKNDNKTRIYLLDKDFDKLIYENIPGERMKGKTYSELSSLVGMFYLDKYSIENYFVDSELLVRTLENTIPQDAENRAIQGYHSKIKKFIQELESSLIVFTAYMIINKKRNLKIKSYKSIDNFYNKSESKVLTSEESSFVKEVKTRYEEEVGQNAGEEMDKWKSTITTDDIRGKTLYEIIHKKIQNDFKENIGTYHLQASPSTFLYHLSTNSDLENFKSLKDKVIKFLENTIQIEKFEKVGEE